MSLAKFELNEFPTFGRKLMKLARGKNIGSPILLAEALYDNCRELVEPAQRKNKHGKVVKDRAHDIDAIRRMVQTHFNEEYAYNIQSKYLYAYSELFQCSLDYLYGKIDTPTPDATIGDICNKTGLSATAVANLMAKEEICMEDYLQAIYNYGFWASPEIGEYDSALDDYFVNTYASVSDFWSKVLESPQFLQIPANWYRMACALYTSKAVKLMAEDAEKEIDELPSYETFISWVETWESLHPNEPVEKLPGLDWDEIYEQDPFFIKQVYIDIRRKHRYSSIERSEDYETAYWGCSGKFDRSALDFFHQSAEEWCLSGQFPNIFE